VAGPLPGAAPALVATGAGGAGGESGAGTAAGIGEAGAAAGEGPPTPPVKATACGLGIATAAMVWRAMMVGGTNLKYSMVYGGVVVWKGCRKVGW